MHACRGGGETDAPRLAAAALPPTDAPTLRSALRSALAPDCSLQRWHSHSSSGTCAPPPQTPPHRARGRSRVMHCCAPRRHRGGSGGGGGGGGSCTCDGRIGGWQQARWNASGHASQQSSSPPPSHTPARPHEAVSE
jgi:hypothetical protein